MSPLEIARRRAFCALILPWAAAVFQPCVLSAAFIAEDLEIIRVADDAVAKAFCAPERSAAAAEKAAKAAKYRPQLDNPAALYAALYAASKPTPRIPTSQEQINAVEKLCAQLLALYIGRADCRARMLKADELVAIFLPTLDRGAGSEIAAAETVGAIDPNGFAAREAEKLEFGHALQQVPGSGEIVGTVIAGQPANSGKQRIQFSTVAPKRKNAPPPLSQPSPKPGTAITANKAAQAAEVAARALADIFLNGENQPLSKQTYIRHKWRKLLSAAASARKFLDLLGPDDPFNNKKPYDVIKDYESIINDMLSSQGDRQAPAQRLQNWLDKVHRVLSHDDGVKTRLKTATDEKSLAAQIEAGREALTSAASALRGVQSDAAISRLLGELETLSSAEPNAETRQAVADLLQKLSGQPGYRDLKTALDHYKRSHDALIQTMALRDFLLSLNAYQEFEKQALSKDAVPYGTRFYGVELGRPLPSGEYLNYKLERDTSGKTHRGFATASGLYFSSFDGALVIDSSKKGTLTELSFRGAESKRYLKHRIDIQGQSKTVQTYGPDGKLQSRQEWAGKRPVSKTFIDDWRGGKYEARFFDYAKKQATIGAWNERGLVEGRIYDFGQIDWSPDAKRNHRPLNDAQFTRSVVVGQGGRKVFNAQHQLVESVRRTQKGFEIAEFSPSPGIEKIETLRDEHGRVLSRVIFKSNGHRIEELPGGRGQKIFHKTGKLLGTSLNPSALVAAINNGTLDQFFSGLLPPHPPGAKKAFLRLLGHSRISGSPTRALSNEKTMQKVWLSSDGKLVFIVQNVQMVLSYEQGKAGLATYHLIGPHKTPELYSIAVFNPQTRTSKAHYESYSRQGFSNSQAQWQRAKYFFSDQKTFAGHAKFDPMFEGMEPPGWFDFFKEGLSETLATTPVLAQLSSLGTSIYTGAVFVGQSGGALVSYAFGDKQLAAQFSADANAAIGNNPIAVWMSGSAYVPEESARTGLNAAILTYNDKDVIAHQNDYILKAAQDSVTARLLGEGLSSHAVDRFGSELGADILAEDARQNLSQFVGATNYGKQFFDQATIAAASGHDAKAKGLATAGFVANTLQGFGSSGPMLFLGGGAGLLKTTAAGVANVTTQATQAVLLVKMTTNAASLLRNTASALRWGGIATGKLDDVSDLTSYVAAAKDIGEAHKSRLDPSLYSKIGADLSDVAVTAGMLLALRGKTSILNGRSGGEVVVKPASTPETEVTLPEAAVNLAVLPPSLPPPPPLPPPANSKIPQAGPPSIVAEQGALLLEALPLNKAKNVRIWVDGQGKIVSVNKKPRGHKASLVELDIYSADGGKPTVLMPTDEALAALTPAAQKQFPRAIRAYNDKRRIENIRHARGLNDEDLDEMQELARMIREADLPGTPQIDRLFYDLESKDMPEQGIKIRVSDYQPAAGDSRSAITQGRKKILAAFLEAAKDPELVRHFDFKVTLAMNAMKGTQEGKFVTIYSRDPAAALTLIDRLDKFLMERGLPKGKLPPEDFPYGESGLVAWRYGKFTGSLGYPLVFSDDQGAMIHVKDSRTNAMHNMEAAAKYLPQEVIGPWLSLARSSRP